MTEPLYMTQLGNWLNDNPLRAWRKRTKPKVTLLVVSFECACSIQSVINWENGSTLPRMASMEALARLMGTTRPHLDEAWARWNAARPKIKIPA